MQQRSEQDRRGDDAARARRERIVERVCRIIWFPASCFWLLVFIMAVRTGYLSWIGVTVAAVFVLSAIVAPVLGWAGKKRLAALCHAVHFGMMTLAAVLVGATFLWPRDSGTWRPYRFAQELAMIEARRAVPDAENAARPYESVFAGMDLDDEPNFLFSGSSLRDELGQRPWKANEYPQASARLDSQSATIEKLLEIGRMEKCRWPVQADMYDEYTVPYKKLRRSMLLLIATGNRDLGEGRVADALTKYFCTVRIADHIHQQPSTVDSMTSFGCERDGLRMIRYVLVQCSLSDENIGEIAQHLPPATDPWPEEWERLLEFEKLRYMNLLGQLYEVNAEGAVRFATQPFTSPKDQEHGGGFPRWYWLMSMPRNPQAVHGLVDKYFATFDHRVNSPHPSQTNQNGRLRRASLRDYSKAMCNCYRWALEAMFFTEQEYTDHPQRRVPAITIRRGTWLVLGLRRYRDAHGTWPPTLDTIAEYVPPEAFVDPTTGDAFVYALDGDGFKLYSKGHNRIDEGGRHRYLRVVKRSEDDVSLWPPPVAEPDDDDSTDEEMMKELESAYGRSYVETYMKGKGSDKR